MANNTNRLAGVANISVDGVTYLLSGEFTYSSADVERKTLTGQDQVHGYSEMPRAPFISCTLRDAVHSQLKILTRCQMSQFTLNWQMAKQLQVAICGLLTLRK
jgi:hypothetical protein